MSCAVHNIKRFGGIEVHLTWHVCDCLQHTLAPPPRLEFVGQPAGAKAHALRPVCALEVQDISLTLPPSDSAGRLSRDTSTTLAGGLQRSHPGLKLGLGPGHAPRTEGSPAQPVVPGISWV